MEIGSKVRVKAPFDESFPDQYTVEQITQADDGNTIVYLAGIESAFSTDHLELSA